MYTRHKLRARRIDTPIPQNTQFHMCDWCGSPHSTEECYRRDPLNMVRYPHKSWSHGVPPTSVLRRYNKPHPRDPSWYRTATLIKVRSHLQRLKDINDTYDSDLKSDRTMSPTTSQNLGSNTWVPTIGLQQAAAAATTAATAATNSAATYIDLHGEAVPALPTQSKQLQTKRQCLWCKGIGHSTDRCYSRDPANLTLFPHSRWPNGEVPQYMTLKYNKKLTQEEAQRIREGATRTPPPILTANTSDNNASTSIKTGKDKKEKATDWLSGISWRKNWCS
jgi:hypothetical protein